MQFVQSLEILHSDWQFVPFIENPSLWMGSWSNYWKSYTLIGQFVQTLKILHSDWAVSQNIENLSLWLGGSNWKLVHIIENPSLWFAVRPIIENPSLCLGSSSNYWISFTLIGQFVQSSKILHSDWAVPPRKKSFSLIRQFCPIIQNPSLWLGSSSIIENPSLWLGSSSIIENPSLWLGSLSNY